MPKRYTCVHPSHLSCKPPKDHIVRVTDLVELILEPLANQIDRARLEILDRIQEVNDSADIIAAEMRRQLNE